MSYKKTTRIDGEYILTGIEGDTDPLLDTHIGQWALVREKRNKLLEDSDWTQVPDIAPTKNPKWATYRQQLRDITTQADPYNIVWPTSPGD